MKTLSITFTGEIWFWRGPAPYLFVTVPPKHSQTLRSIMKTVTYGWGMIPATVRIGNTTFKTSLFPQDGGYIVPIKVVVQRAEDLNQGDTVTLQLDVNQP